MAEILKVYIDGSSLGNPGPGGWAVIVADGNKVLKIVSGGKSRATNSEMELTALLYGINEIPSNKKAYVYSDSSYIVNGVTKRLSNWQRRQGKKADGKPVAYWPLWQKIGDILKNKDIKVMWVKGHSGDKLNELADKQAKQQALKYR